MKSPPWVVVIFRGGVSMSYPAESREQAEADARGLAMAADGAVEVGIYERRALAVVETSVRFEGMPS